MALSKECNQILVAPTSNHPCLRMWPKLSTPIQVVISLVQGMWPNFNHFDERLPLSKNATKIVYPCLSTYWLVQGVCLNFNWPLENYKNINACVCHTSSWIEIHEYFDEFINFCTFIDAWCIFVFIRHKIWDIWRL